MKRIILLLVFCLLLVGCSSNKTKEAKTLDDFENISINAGFSVTNNMDAYQGNDYITGSKQAILNDITIEMVTYDNDDNAKKTQDEHVKFFKTMKGSGAVINKENGKNYYKYYMISNGYYMISSRIDNTLIFSRTTVENKDKIEEIINELDY